MASGRALAARFGAWRDRLRAAEGAATWRDEIALWVRALADGVDKPPPAAPALDDLAARFELPEALVAVLALLYGAHLLGDSASPTDIARVGGDWSEALGTGALAAAGIAAYSAAGIRLAAPIQRTLDELPPTSGALVGRPGAARWRGARAVIAHGRTLAAIADASLVATGTAILVVASAADPDTARLEARARGAVAMFTALPPRVPPTETVLVVAADRTTADQLGLPIIAG